MAGAASAIFLLDMKGRVLIWRDYRGDVSAPQAERAFAKLMDGEVWYFYISNSLCIPRQFALPCCFWLCICLVHGLEFGFGAVNQRLSSWLFHCCPTYGVSMAASAWFRKCTFPFFASSYKVFLPVIVTGKVVVGQWIFLVWLGVLVSSYCRCLSNMFHTMYTSLFMYKFSFLLLQGTLDHAFWPWYLRRVTQPHTIPSCWRMV